MEILSKAKFFILFARSSCLLPDYSAGMIYRELWWTNQEFFTVDVIPPWCSLLACRLGDKKIGSFVAAVKRRNLTP
jgi:hypothetical protein